MAKKVDGVYELSDPKINPFGQENFKNELYIDVLNKGFRLSDGFNCYLPLYG